MKYRAKPVVVEAVQWTGSNPHEVKSFAGNDIQFNGHTITVRGDITVFTSEGKTTAHAGYYIVRDDRGNHYPCDPGVFERKYEPAE